MTWEGSLEKGFHPWYYPTPKKGAQTARLHTLFGTRGVCGYTTLNMPACTERFKCTCAADLIVSWYRREGPGRCRAASPGGGVVLAVFWFSVGFPGAQIEFRLDKLDDWTERGVVWWLFELIFVKWLSGGRWCADNPITDMRSRKITFNYGKSPNFETWVGVFCFLKPRK